MGKKDVDHVMVDAVKQAIVCENCGQQESFELPQSVDDFVKGGREFMRKHRYCRLGTHNDLQDAESFVKRTRIVGPTTDRLDYQEGGV